MARDLPTPLITAITGNSTPFVPVMMLDLTLSAGNTWTPDTTYTVGQYYSHLGNSYIVDTAYTSGSSFGSTDTANIATGYRSVHVWSGVGNLAYSGNTYLGVGSLGSVGDVTEGVEVRADGTTVTLSGIDPTLLSDVQNDIQVGAPATVWLGVLDNGALSGTPYPLFQGTVSTPTVTVNSQNLTITLALENRLLDLQRPTMRRYTSSDQNYYYPDDIGFNWVETLNDSAWVWG